MAILTLQELIAKREGIREKRAQKYEIETSIGTILAVLPDAALVAEAIDLPTSFEANKHVAYNCIVEPNLKDSELQKIYGVADPIDIVVEIFSPGELSKIANKLFDLAGFKGKLVTKIHKEIKN